MRVLFNDAQSYWELCSVCDEWMWSIGGKVLTGELKYSEENQCISTFSTTNTHGLTWIEPSPVQWNIVTDWLCEPWHSLAVGEVSSLNGEVLNLILPLSHKFT
jgi:hypothetical protein